MELLIRAALMAGAAAAIAALYGHYRVLPGWLTGPQVCQLDQGGCAVLFRSPRSALLGVPNALLGVVLYGLIGAGLFLAWPASLLFAMTLPAVAMSAFLGWSRCRGACSAASAGPATSRTWCSLSHSA